MTKIDGSQTETSEKIETNKNPVENFLENIRNIFKNEDFLRYLDENNLDIKELGNGNLDKELLTFLSDKNLSQIEIKTLNLILKFSEEKKEVLNISNDLLEKLGKYFKNNFYSEKTIDLKKIKDEGLDEIYEKYFKTYEKYGDELEVKGLPETIKKAIKFGFEKFIVGKTVEMNIEGEIVKVKITKEFLTEENFNIMYNNYKNYLIFLMNIESFGGKNVVNKNSSAKGVVQFLDGYSNKTGELISKGQSSFKTALNRVINTFLLGGGKFDRENTQVPKELYDFIIEVFNINKEKNPKLDLKTFTKEQQIILLFIDNLINIKGQKYLLKLLLGDVQAGKDLYNKIHHTNGKGDESTKKVVESKTLNLKYVALL